jgi:acyl carrier protein
MDFFICLSSTSGIMGAGATSGYSAGNTYMDGFAEWRILKGEKATSIDLGWMKSEGVVAENSFLSTGVSAFGFLIPLSQEDLYALLDYHCNPNLPLATPMTCRAVIGLETPAGMRAKGIPEPHFMQRRTYRFLQQIMDGDITSAHDEKEVQYRELFQAASCLEQAAQVVTEGLVRKLSKAIAIPQPEIDTSKSLGTYGVDSLLAVELRNYFTSEFGAEIAVFDITGSGSFTDVSMKVAKKSQFSRAAWAEGSK